ncbi:uncharacterized protein LOC118803127 [Colossoma macropomum]|uniref:uncharacterized protein LOC118803127 n=1 Tax=Colossoma macropomum TaxID=42526 RepID=UPI001864F423|nr:uncharacterized protein LOC118803127 [Colossoma macropomum]
MTRCFSILRKSGCFVCVNASEGEVQFRMEIFLIFTLYLISGQVDCVDVIGYAGGSVLINCQFDPLRYTNHTKYLCKINRGTQCTEKILPKTQNTRDQEGRFFLMDGNGPGLYSVLIKNISQQDDGTYRCGVEEKRDVTMKVKEDPCCGKTLTQKTHAGETVTFTCQYPQESKYLSKHLCKVTNHKIHVVISALGQSRQKERFSLFDHPQENLFNVSISDVTEEDGGVYLCGVHGQKKGDQNTYNLNEIQLEVTGISTSSSVIIIVCVCAALLLIGGLLLIYRLRFNKAGGSPNMLMGRNNTAEGDYENDRPGIQNINGMGSTYQYQNPNTNQSDSAYQSLNPSTNQSDSAYECLNPNTNQSDSAYQNLNPNTNQSDSAYQSLRPNATQSNSVYHSLNPNSIQSDSVHQNLNPTVTNLIQPARV